MLIGVLGEYGTKLGWRMHVEVRADEFAVPFIVWHTRCGTVDCYYAASSAHKVFQCVELWLVEDFTDAVEKDDD